MKTQILLQTNFDQARAIFRLNILWSLIFFLLATSSIGQILQLHAWAVLCGALFMTSNIEIYGRIVNGLLSHAQHGLKLLIFFTIKLALLLLFCFLLLGPLRQQLISAVIGIFVFIPAFTSLLILRATRILVFKP